ncbi:MAG: beta-ketoacyl-[acyl-carrier-protein] synthase family protein, partial [bacterium]|nr:beta-ketoacyl-[acyl-carrier-protein] synthase family protein [bacterium]
WRAMSSALKDGGVEAGKIGYINAHATGTRAGDPAEAAAIARLLGDAASDVPVSSTKAVHGHLVGAAGGLEAAITLRALETGRVPPTAHLTELDPECRLDCVPIEGRAVRKLEYALSNSFAFGGTNATLVLRRV